MPTTEDFREEVSKMIITAKKEGKKYIDISSKEVHMKLGGYPAKNGRHAMQSCCRAIYSLMKTGDDILCAPASGYGASVKVRFYLE